MYFWDKKTECMSLDELRELQGERLKNTVRFAYDNVPFYRRKLDAAGVNPEDIKSIDDITKLPFTTKRISEITIRLGCSLFRLTVVRIHQVLGQQENRPLLDIQKTISVWSEAMARTLSAAARPR